MGKPTGFLEFTRQDLPKRPVRERLRDYRELESMLNDRELSTQGARCMDCGIPHCHTYGCPVSNNIQDFNDMVFRGRWREALDCLHSTNNFPEFTGRICPAPCEAACTLAIQKSPVAIRELELAIVERGWEEGWIVPEAPNSESGKKVAVIGSGPAGLAAAQQIRRRGHQVVVFERDGRAGGMLRYGIPDFKLDKGWVQRRQDQMVSEGVVFETGVDVGKDLSAAYLRRSFDSVVLTMGARAPRDVNVQGRELEGIHFAMDFLSQNNRRVSGEERTPAKPILAAGKHVVVIGGGDTGSDCVGTSNRQGAASVTQLEVLEKPPLERQPSNPWPYWPRVLTTSTSHEEGCERKWALLTKHFAGTEGRVTGLVCVKMEWAGEPKAWRETAEEVILPADLVFIAAGFLGPEKGRLVEEMGMVLDPRGWIKTDQKFMTSVPGIFAAGDCVKGPSLVVHAINQGRKAAEGVEIYLRDY